MSTTTQIDLAQEDGRKIFPAGFEDRFALGSPDGRILRDGEYVELLLDGSWHGGWIEHRYRSGARFVSQQDKSVCGLCSGMKVRLPGQRVMGGTHDAN